MDFVHLHTHSEYSLCDAISPVSGIPKRAKECGQSALALTEHGVMFGAVDFYDACKKEGIKPIIGSEPYLAKQTRFDRDDPGKYRGSYHLILLCKNEVGYKNLIKIMSAAYTEGYCFKPRIDMDLLASHHEGLIALSACPAGYVSKAIDEGDYQRARSHAKRMKEIFGDDYYLEIMDHNHPDEKALNIEIVKLSRELKIPLVATNDGHRLHRSDVATSLVSGAIQTNNVVCVKFPTNLDDLYSKSTDEIHELFGNYSIDIDEAYNKSTEEMHELFSYLDSEELGSPIENTARIAEKCNFDFDFSTLHHPAFATSDGSASEVFLARLAREGLTRYLASGRIQYTDKHPEKEYLDRLERELGDITHKGYSDYFLIVQDFVSYAKVTGISVGCGKDSAGGSLVAFLIGITDIDPIDSELAFEGFLDLEHNVMPRFGIEFDCNRCVEVMEYARRRYGYEHVARIMSFERMDSIEAIRSVGRALVLPDDVIDSVVKLIPSGDAVTIDAALELSNELREMYESSPKVKMLISIAKRFEGMPRRTSTHASGIVIADRPVYEYVPLAVNNGVVVTQFETDAVSRLGLLKIDFLDL